MVYIKYIIQKPSVFLKGYKILSQYCKFKKLKNYLINFTKTYNKYFYDTITVK